MSSKSWMNGCEKKTLLSLRYLLMMRIQVLNEWERYKDNAPIRNPPEVEEVIDMSDVYGTNIFEAK